MEGEANTPPQRGRLAAAAGHAFPLTVCRSAGGYYLGTQDEEGFPVSRESVEYWPTPDDARQALDQGRWTQHRIP